MTALPETGREPEKEAFVLEITRLVAAPRELVFSMWTQAEHFARWFGPRGSSIAHCRLDARAGGRLHFLHQAPGHEDLWVRGSFLEVIPGERLVFDFGFADQHGALAERPGFAAETRVSVSFADAGAGTRLSIRQSGLVADQGESEGWRQGLDRLEELLAHF